MNKFFFFLSLFLSATLLPGCPHPDDDDDDNDGGTEPCNPGYYRNDGGTCVDCDECAAIIPEGCSKADCGKLQCYNFDGGHECLPEGSNPPKSCIAHHDCNLPSEGCYNGHCGSHPARTRVFSFYPEARFDFSWIHVSGDFNGWPNCAEGESLTNYHMKQKGDSHFYLVMHDFSAGNHCYKYVICYPGFCDECEGMNGVEWVTPPDAEWTQPGIGPDEGCFAM